MKGNMNRVVRFPPNFNLKHAVQSFSGNLLSKNISTQQYSQESLKGLKLEAIFQLTELLNDKRSEIKESKMKIKLNSNDLSFSIEITELKSWKELEMEKEKIYYESLVITVQGAFCFYNDQQQIQFQPNFPIDLNPIIFKIPEIFYLKPLSHN
jgi:hypothetical protein